MKIQPVIKKYHPYLEDTYLANLKNHPDAYVTYDDIITGSVLYYDFKDKDMPCTIVFKCYII